MECAERGGKDMSWKKGPEPHRPGKDSGFLSEDNENPYMVDGRGVT